MTDPIPLAPDVDDLKGPNLPGRVVVRADRHSVYDALGAELMVCAVQCVEKYGDFHIALSGGSTPFPFYEQLMTDPHYRMFPWSHTHLWIVDERRVAFDNPLSNWRQISEIFADHSGIPAAQMHPMMATVPDVAAQYESALHAALAARPRGEARLDFVLLGMGDNGHTASLFPQTAVLDERVKWVGDCDGPTVTPPARVTMTYPLINAARHIAVLVLGENKAEMITRIATGSDDFHALPIKGIRPSDANAGDAQAAHPAHAARGELVWYLDKAASGV